MSGTDVIGDIAEGALAARALEPAHGESGSDDHSGQCLNCGTALLGKHCHGCGQTAHVHRTLSSFVHDLLHGVFHFEGKIWRTLPMLAWQPGRLTREYIDGKRASYVSPIALFLFCMFLMFAVVKQVAHLPTDLSIGGKQDLGEKVAEGKAKLATLEKQRAELVRQGKDTEKTDDEIETARQSIDIMQEIKANGAEKAGPSSDVPAIDRALKAFTRNPGLVFYKLQSNAYKFSWALIPISVPFVWLLFPFSRRFGLYDHTVFVTYSLCFMALGVCLLTLGSLINLPFLALLAILLPPWHMHRQLRGTYGLSFGGALWRTATLLIFASTALGLFAMLILAQSAE